MFRFTSATAAAALLAASAAVAAQQTTSPSLQLPTAPPGAPTICQYVLTSQEESKPFKLCLTREQWKVADSRDSKDPNVMECHIQPDIESKLRSYKICQPASRWRQDQQDARDAVEWIQRQTPCC